MRAGLGSPGPFDGLKTSGQIGRSERGFAVELMTAAGQERTAGTRRSEGPHASIRWRGVMVARSNHGSTRQALVLLARIGIGGADPLGTIMPVEGAHDLACSLVLQRVISEVPATFGLHKTVQTQMRQML